MTGIGLKMAGTESFGDSRTSGFRNNLFIKKTRDKSKGMASSVAVRNQGFASGEWILAFTCRIVISRAYLISAARTIFLEFELARNVCPLCGFAPLKVGSFKIRTPHGIPPNTSIIDADLHITNLQPLCHYFTHWFIRMLRNWEIKFLLIEIKSYRPFWAPRLFWMSDQAFFFMQ